MRGFLSALLAFGSALANEIPTTFTLEECPGYELVANDPSDLKVDNVKQQSGYLSTPSGDRLFYWYFTSRNDPAKDPLVVWLNGGPGCSSLQAVLMENGPSTIVDGNGQLQRNQWSWNNNANVLYIDNPADAGYSVGQSVADTITASNDFKNALKMFYEQRPELESNPLHIAGESYAGRYIPVFAEAVNEFHMFNINVSSILIGNGLVSPVAEYAAYQPMMCGEGGYPSRLSSAQCQQLANETPRCLQSMQQCMADVGNGGGNGFNCRMASLFCNGLQRSFSGLNPYDIRDARCTQTQVGLCYHELDWAQSYFNQPNVIASLGADPSFTQKGYEICNNQVNREFYATGDPYAPTIRNISTLLSQDTAVLAYNGDADIVLNWLGGKQWTQEVEWPQQQAFQAAHARDWAPDGQKRGEVTNVGKLTFLRVIGAGHMVPHNQPESAYLMLTQWLEGDYALRKRK